MKNNECPLVSVIIPTRNRKELLIRALKSVLCQVYESIEIIIVDDNSIDGTFPEISLKFQEDIGHHKIKIFRNEKLMGNAKTRNIGIRKSNGEYVAFLDDDDVWLPDKIDKQIKEILQSRVEACFCGTIWVENDKILKSTIARNSMISFENGGPTSSWLIHRRVFDDIGFFDEKFPANVDGEFLVRLNKNFNTCFVNELLYIHYYYDLQISSSKKMKIIGFEKMLKKHKAEFNSCEKSSAYFKLAIFYLFEEKKRFDYILKSIYYKLHLKNISLLIIMLFPSKTFSKLMVNKILDFVQYPKSFAGRYNK